MFLVTPPPPPSPLAGPCCWSGEESGTNGVHQCGESASPYPGVPGGVEHGESGRNCTLRHQQVCSCCGELQACSKNCMAGEYTRGGSRKLRRGVHSDSYYFAGAHFYDYEYQSKILWVLLYFSYACTISMLVLRYILSTGNLP